MNRFNCVIIVFLIIFGINFQQTQALKLNQLYNDLKRIQNDKNYALLNQNFKKIKSKFKKKIYL